MSLSPEELQYARTWVLLPNSGLGSRFGARIPKQYTKVSGKTVLEWTIDRLKLCGQFKGLVLVNRKNDPHWDIIKTQRQYRLQVLNGGDERSESILNGLNWIVSNGHPDDWVLVHDVARPIFDLHSINELIDVAVTKDMGSILATRVSDTLRKDLKDGFTLTLDRQDVWQAQTPQYFKVSDLHRALLTAKENGIHLTDEASAIELIGLPVHLIQGSRLNIKLTYHEDLALIEYFLKGILND